MIPCNMATLGRRSIRFNTYLLHLELLSMNYIVYHVNDIVRAAVFGYTEVPAADGGKPEYHLKEALHFPANNLVIDSVDIQEVPLPLAALLAAMLVPVIEA